MEFIPYEMEKDEEEEEDFCRVCGSLDISIGYNENAQIYKYDCSNCGSVAAVNNDGELFFIEGGERDWEKYLSENLEFPFIAEITEMSDRELFNPDNPGPICYYTSLAKR